MNDLIVKCRDFKNVIIVKDNSSRNGFKMYIHPKTGYCTACDDIEYKSNCQKWGEKGCPKGGNYLS